MAKKSLLCIRLGTLLLALAGTPLLALPPQLEILIEDSCTDCHHQTRAKGGLDLESVYQEDFAAHRETWETVLHRLRTRQMPPPDRDRPSEAVYREIVSALETDLDTLARDQPDPGRTETFRRLTRYEYQCVIRDLLHLEIDTSSLLPTDEISHGFDNVTVGELSPALMERYVAAAQKISRLAVGTPSRVPLGETFRVPPDVTQEHHVPGLPLGTRGGLLIPYTFPRDGDYEITVRLARDRNEHVEGLKRDHTLEVLIDRQSVSRFTVHRPREEGDHQTADAHLQARVRVPAGARTVGVTFLQDSASLEESKRQPFLAHFNMHRHPRLTPAIYQVSITGPHGDQATSSTPSRERIFSRRPSGPEDEEDCAREILSQILRRAYRRPVTASDLEGPLTFFRNGRAEGGFDAGIELALSAILVSPEFLFRIERDPADLPPGTAYAISDLELASRLSFFLWSSLPDDTLLAVAEAGELSDPARLREQVQRMLDDPRSHSLVENFAGQWLYLRNLASITPDLRLFPDFDDNLRQALRQETERFLASILRENRTVAELLESRYTFLNERLAKHYGIPHIYGSRFRRVNLDQTIPRGGLLRQGSVLTVTSYATRTSPVIRGNWILENLLGTPAPPPPPDVPTLEDNVVSGQLPIRQRLAQHRADPACASCHDLMDPVGFALENFDAIGRWRTTEEGQPVDASGGLPDGSEFTGVQGLEQALVRRPDIFAGVIAEKLMVFALGRGIDYRDAAAIRQVVRQAAAHGFPFTELIHGITQSEPFLRRRTHVH